MIGEITFRRRTIAVLKRLVRPSYFAFTITTFRERKSSIEMNQFGLKKLQRMWIEAFERKMKEKSL